MKPNYELKSKVLASGCVYRVKKMDNAVYQLCVNGIVPSFDTDDEYINILFEYGGTYLKEARKINLATYRRDKRLKDRITQYLLSGQCIFLTLEFDDDTLSNTSRETRRKYVQRYLKSVSDKYVANIDFGGKKGREHYHAVVLVDWIDVKWDYGYIWREKIHRTNSETKLAKYISKLTNHAIKETTKRCCYIYSRS